MCMEICDKCELGPYCPKCVAQNVHQCTNLVTPRYVENLQQASICQVELGKSNEHIGHLTQRVQMLQSETSHARAAETQNDMLVQELISS